MLKKYVAYGPGFSGDYDTSEEAWAVCAKHPEGHVYVAIDLSIQPELNFLHNKVISLSDYCAKMNVDNERLQMDLRDAEETLKRIEQSNILQAVKSYFSRKEWRAQGTPDMVHAQQEKQ